VYIHNVKAFCYTMPATNLLASHPQDQVDPCRQTNGLAGCAHIHAPNAQCRGRRRSRGWKARRSAESRSAASHFSARRLSKRLPSVGLSRVADSQYVVNRSRMPGGHLGNVQFETYRTLLAGRFTKFGRGDVGKAIEIKNGAVTVDAIKRHVDWGGSAHPDCRGKIKSVETRVKGHVKLEDGSVFENCAISSIDELTTSALVSSWIKDAAVTGDDRLADRPECDLARLCQREPIFLRPKVLCRINLKSFKFVPSSVRANQPRRRASAQILHLACVARPARDALRRSAQHAPECVERHGSVARLCCRQPTQRHTPRGQ
jgi:hypothetical protein